MLEDPGGRRPSPEYSASKALSLSWSFALLHAGTLRQALIPRLTLPGGRSGARHFRVTALLTA